MRSWFFWSSLPFLLPQAWWVRRRTPRFAAPTDAETGRILASDRKTMSWRLVGLGDSIIAGVGAQIASQCLTAQLARELSERHRVTVDWHNVGRIGATTARVLHGLAPRLPPSPAHLFLVSVGVNDVTSLRRRDVWAREILALADLLQAHSPGASALFLGLPPMQLFPALPTPLRHCLGLRARLFDETLASTLADHPTARHLPLTHLPLTSDAPADMFSADGFHPSPSAYALIAKALADTQPLVTLRSNLAGE